MDSGFLGACSGAFGRLAFKDLDWNDWHGMLIRAPFLIAMILANGLMVSRHVKALESASSCLQVQILNFVSNFVSSLVFSVVIFQEFSEQMGSMKFWLGSLCMIGGVVLILSENSSKKRKN